MTMTLYLAGPMTNIPKFNFPRFELFAAILRQEGWRVISPHEEDPGDTAEAAWASETGDVADLPGTDTPLDTAIRNVEGIYQADGVALLPGWYKSAGTRMEVETAHRFGIPVAPVQLWLDATTRGSDSPAAVMASFSSEMMDAVDQLAPTMLLGRGVVVRS